MPNPTEFSSVWWILVAPLIGFLIQAFIGKMVVGSLGPSSGKRVMGAIATVAIAIPFAIAVMTVMKMVGMDPEHRSIVVYGFPWISVLSANIPFELIIDPLSMTMVLIITGVGGLIHLYATGYMGEDRDYTRFFTYMNLFVVSMLLLVLGNNLALLFIGWEGVGLCSYLLIGFWYHDIANSKAANKAFIVNRIGDWGLTLGMFLIFVLLAGNADKALFPDGRFLSYDRMLPAIGTMLVHAPGLATAIALLLFVGACGKSAQFPLYLWLPDAMAGPTPVSALIHAATMVTSGVVLLNRMHVVYELSPVASAVVACIGAFTALFAALVAFGQIDIKKVLAYSTVSQLGFMFIGCGVGAYWTGMFHVTTHAFFKALLFLGSGAVIYAMAHNQDMRNYGNLKKYLPITCWTMVVGYVAIGGYALYNIFGFAGFYSKEAILGSAIANTHANVNAIAFSQIAGWTGLFVAALTSMYMTRMTWLTFFGGEERWRQIPAHAHGAHDHDSVAHEGAIAHTQEAHAVAEEGHAVAEDSSPVLQHELHVAEGQEAASAAHGMEEHAHGPDIHGFFFEHEPHEEHEEHHELDQTHTPKEAPISMTLPLIVLAVLSAFGGWAMANNQMFERWLEPSSGPKFLGEISEHPHGIDLALLSMIAAFGGLIVGYLVYRNGLPKKEGWDEARWNPFRRAAGAQFGYDRAMVSSAVDGGASLGIFSWRVLDAGLIDGIVNGVASVAGGLGKGFKTIQTGFVRSYALLMLAGGLGILIWLYLAMMNLPHETMAAPPDAVRTSLQGGPGR